MQDKLIESLERVLVDRDRSIQELRGVVESLQALLEKSKSAWCLPRIGQDNPNLPLPRLEMEWVDETQKPSPPWTCYMVEYRLVQGCLSGKVLFSPLGVTRVKGGVHECPWALDNGRVDLPFGDGPSACFDSGHLNLPLYLITPSSPPIEVNAEDYGPYQYRKGQQQRRG